MADVLVCDPLASRQKHHAGMAEERCPLHGSQEAERKTRNKREREGERDRGPDRVPRVMKT